MKNRIFTLPNIITLCNLACGCAATVFALSTGGRLNIAFWFIAAGAVCDFCDGLVARLTGRYSPLGEELDSLADMVTFGVAPSAVLFTVYRYSLSLWSVPEWIGDALGWCVFAVALFAALRLAIFNLDWSQAGEFKGLPTPAAALAIAALGWMWYMGDMSAPREIIVVFVALVCWLLISPIRMFSLKFKGFGWHGNELRYLFLIVATALVAVFGIAGVPLAVALYIVVSTVRWVYLLSREKSANCNSK